MTTSPSASTDPNRSPILGVATATAAPSASSDPQGGSPTSSSTGATSASRKRRPSTNHHHHHHQQASAHTHTSASPGPPTSGGNGNGSSTGTGGGTAGSTARTPASSERGSTSSHRRSRSLGGLFFGGAAEALSSPIGGPDGVDPNLVAAISASGQDIPGAHLLHHHHHHHHHHRDRDHHQSSRAAIEGRVHAIPIPGASPAHPHTGTASSSAAASPHTTFQSESLGALSSSPGVLSTPSSVVMPSSLGAGAFTHSGTGAGAAAAAAAMGSGSFHSPASAGTSSAGGATSTAHPATATASGNSSANPSSSTPSSSSSTAAARTLNRKPSAALLSVMPDTRALANTYPTMTMPSAAARSGSGSTSASPAESSVSGSVQSPSQAHVHPHPFSATDGEHHSSALSSTANSPTLLRGSVTGFHPASLGGGERHTPAQPTPVLGGPASYARSRVRSQTMAPRVPTATTLDGGGGGAEHSSPGGDNLSGGAGGPPSRSGSGYEAGSEHSPISTLSASVGAGGGSGARGAGGGTFPLADAIRLQRVPTAVRLAGDLFVPSSPVSGRRATALGPFATPLDTPGSASGGGRHASVSAGGGGSNTHSGYASLSSSMHAAAGTATGPGAPGTAHSHGLGIGLSSDRFAATMSRHAAASAAATVASGSGEGGSLPIPQTPSTTRSTSPAYNPAGSHQGSHTHASLAEINAAYAASASGGGGGGAPPSSASTASGQTSPVLSIRSSGRDRMSGSFVVPRGFYLGSGPQQQQPGGGGSHSAAMSDAGSGAGPLDGFGRLRESRAGSGGSGSGGGGLGGTSSSPASRRVSGVMTGAPPSPTARRMEVGSLRDRGSMSGGGPGSIASAFSPLLSLGSSGFGGGGPSAAGGMHRPSSYSGSGSGGAAAPMSSPVLGPTRGGTFAASEGGMEGRPLERREGSGGPAVVGSLSKSSSLSRSFKAESDAEIMPPPPLPLPASSSSSSALGGGGGPSSSSKPRPTTQQQPKPPTQPQSVLDSATYHRSGPAPWIASSREVPAKVTRSPPSSSSRPSSSHGMVEPTTTFGTSGGILFSRAVGVGPAGSAGTVGSAAGSMFGSSFQPPVSSGRLAMTPASSSGFAPRTPVLRSAEDGADEGKMGTAVPATGSGTASASGSSYAGPTSSVRRATSSVRPRSGAGGSSSLAGTDEYSRIIVQSRNAKVQRWKSSVQARQALSGHAQAQALFRSPSSALGSPALTGERTPMQRMDSAESYRHSPPSRIPSHAKPEGGSGGGVGGVSLSPPAPSSNAAAGLNAPVHSNAPGTSAGLGVGLQQSHLGGLGVGAGYKGAHGLERRGTIIGLMARESDTSVPLSDSMDSMPGGLGNARTTAEADSFAYSFYGGPGGAESQFHHAGSELGGGGGGGGNDDYSGAAGAREIEWVDWLDEYRKMKEAKLRSEQVESEAEVEADSELGHPGPESVPQQPADAGPHAGDGTPGSQAGKEDAAKALPIPTGATGAKDPIEELADEGGEADAGAATTTRSHSDGQLAQPQRSDLAYGYRRPSGIAAYDTSDQRRVVSAGVATDSGRYGALAASSPIQRLGAMPSDNKPRMVSLSPIPARVTSTSSQASSSTGTSNSTAMGMPVSSSARRRRNLLGSKIENWWNAVKTGFAQPGQTESPPASSRGGLGRAAVGFGSSQQRSPSSSGLATPREGAQTTPNSPNQQLPYFIPGASAPGGPAGHVQTSKTGPQRNDVASGLSSAVGELRRQVSSRHLDSTASTAAASSASLAPSTSDLGRPLNHVSTSNLSVTDAQSGIDIEPSPSSAGPTGTSVEPESSQSSSRCSEETTGRDTGRRRNPYLSLDLDKNISSFSSTAFDSLDSSASHLDGSVLASHSPRIPSPLAGVVSSAQPSPKQLSDVGRARLANSGRASSTPSPKSQSRPMTAEQAKTGNEASALGPSAAADTGPDHLAPSTATRPMERQKEEDSKQVSSKEITIHSIRQHIRHRLAVSKESCDKELCKVIAAVTQFVEDQVITMQAAADGTEDADIVEEIFSDETDTESGPATSQALDHSLSGRRMGSMRGQSISSAAGSVGGGMDSVFGDLEDLVDPDETPQPIESSLEAPTPRRGADLAAGAAMQVHEGRSFPSSPLRGSIGRSSKSGASGLPLARHKSLRQYNRSASTSRSTSRSHSPMPAGLSQASAPSESPRLSPVRRFRPLPAEDLPTEPYIPALQDLVTVAMEVLDTPIQNLTSRPGACSSIISHIQTIGKTWDNNPDFPGRGWYVQLLLAVAGLSRVVEWWEAEKGFWNFDDENDQADAEPLHFIMSGQAAEGGEVQDAKGSQGTGAASAISSPARNMSLSGPRRPGGSNSPTLDMRDRRTVSESDSSRILAGQQADADVSSQPLDPVEEVPGSPGKEAINVLMELSLDCRFIYLSPAWTVVVGSDPAELYNQPISDWLAPGDSEIFAEATRQLQLDEAHTVEVTFRLRIDPSCASSLSDDRDVDATYFQEMEGKGMLMHDRETRQPTHVMWVFKPTASPELESDLQGDGAVKGAKQLDDTAAAKVASAATISVEPLLCRICERDIPAWFFESHSEICNEIHRLEMEIAEVNESLAELRRTIKAVSLALVEEAQSGAAAPEFRGIPLTTPPPSTQPPSALEGLNKSVAPKQVNHMAVRKAHLRAIDGMLQMLQTAKEISTPAIKEESAAEPIERQRLLTPTSEARMVQVHQWRPTRVDDAAIDSMLAEVESTVRAKLSGVNRMRNTIVYVERVRQEWEERVENALAVTQDASDSGDSAVNLSEEEEVLADVQEESVLETPEDESRNDDEAFEDDEEDGSGSASEHMPDEADASAGNKAGVSSYVAKSRTGSPLIPAANISPTHLPSALPSTALPPAGTSSEASVSSRSRRASHMPTQPGDTPPFTPQHAPSEGQSSAAARRLSTSHRSPLVSTTPLSPRLPPSAPSSRPTASSIKDFEVIKPISKGAFGSVYLAKKKTTGDYFAIKVLKKSDMIAKNQITNVKAERMILMGQTSSPFVVKLFFTFQSKDYLYLVMEYLPGGDCASLCKNLGSLPEEWAKQYIAEVVNGLEQLHEKGVVHRDMKPDNLLIDQRGHLKLTDFGLSKIGLLGRQTRNVGNVMMGHSKSDSASSSTPTSIRSDMGPPSLPVNKSGRGDGSSDFGTSPSSVTPGSAAIVRAQAFFAPAQRGRIVSSSTDVSDSSGSEGPNHLLRAVPPANMLESPSNVFGSHTLPSESASARNLQGTRKFVGTPDYLAPESILGIGMDDMAVDWWALGVILYEFLYGIPPFHAETPDRVFDNILSRRIDWDEDVEVSDAARDLMERLMCTDPQQRLGAKGAAEVKAHAFFEGIKWDDVAAGEGPFVPSVTDPESTDYFDLRGAAIQEFTEEELRMSSTREFANALQRNSRLIEPTRPPSRMRSRTEKAVADPSVDEFGSFSFKNLPVLKQANDEILRKMRGDQLPPMAQALESTIVHARHRSLSGKAGKPGKQRASIHPHPPPPTAPGHGPPSPSTSVSSQSSAPSRSTAPTSPSTAGPYLHNTIGPHKRRPSEYAMGVSASTSSLVGVSNAIMDRKRSLLAEGESDGASRKATRMRTSSLGASSDRAPVAVAQSWQEPGAGLPSGGFAMESSFSGGSATGSGAPHDRGPASDGTRPSVSNTSDGASAVATTSSDHTGTCLIAEDNPIALRMLENILSRLGLRTISVKNGAEATRLAMGDVRYSALFIDLTLPIVSGQDAAKMIKSTRNVNSSTPIVALASYDRDEPIDVSHSVFDAVLAKPPNKPDIVAVFQKLGFSTSAGLSGPRERRGTFMFPPPAYGPQSLQTPSHAPSSYVASETIGMGLTGLSLDPKRSSASDMNPGMELLPSSTTNDWTGSTRRQSNISGALPPRTPLERPLH